MKDPKEYNVRAIERAIHILDCFDDQNPTWGLTELAQEVGLHKATAHRIMTTLLNYNYLEKTKDGQKYKLGIRLASLGCSVVHRWDLRNIALPYMENLVEKFNETCDLSVFDGREIFYLEVMQSNHALTIAAKPGMRLPAHCTASGKVFLAHLPENKLQTFFKLPLRKLTENTITQPQVLRENLSEIKEKGYAVDSEEMEMGIRAISTPIFDQAGEVIAAISIPGPTSRIENENIPELASALKQISKNISRNLGMRI
jgi:DNA-binding IclR family transcriptional regulator